MPILNTQTVQIASGQSLSPEVDIYPGTLVGIFLPSTWTSASVTFQASPDGGVTWGELYNYATAEVTFTGAASTFVQIDPTQWKGVNALKIRSGTPGSPVTQTSTVTITLITRQMVS